MHDDDTLSILEDERYGRLPRRRRSLSSGGAIYHLHARTGSRSKGHCARAAAAYIQRAGEYRRDQGDELVYTESGHMPPWAEAEPTTYWDAADLYERANGRLFKRVEVALPLALTEAEQRELAVGFAHHLTDAEHLPYTLAIHAGNGTNPHCHLLISERTNDGLERAPEQWFKRYNAAAPERGGARKTEALKPKAWLEETRAAWAAQTNAALERAGHAVRIDHRSLAAQGVERLPGVHLGPDVQAMEARGVETARGAEQSRRAQVNAALAQEQAELAALEREHAAAAGSGRPSRWATVKARVGAWMSREQEPPAQESPAAAQDSPPPASPSPPPPPAENVPERGVAAAETQPAAAGAAPPRPAPGLVAHDPRVEERIRQIEDPAQRARAEALLETLRTEVNAAREQARERDRARDRERDDFDLER